jgi:hypothetical protein
MDGNAFGIVTPGALQAAAFKKDRGPDPGPVFRGHPLDFQNGGGEILVGAVVHREFLVKIV